MKGPYGVGVGSVFQADAPRTPQGVCFYRVVSMQGDHAILCRTDCVRTALGWMPGQRREGSPFRRIVRDGKDGPFIGNLPGGRTATLVPQTDAKPRDEANLDDAGITPARFEKFTGNRFHLGQVVATPNALQSVAPSFALQCLTRHAQGDWGSVDDDDQDANNTALVDGGRLLSRYVDPHGIRLWIITEADRSSTCILLPEDY